ncbi:PrsW family intramembrane metalloprotease, partial [Streptomyces spiralis]
LGRAGADFAARERELLHEMWRRREVAQPALDYAARMTAPPVRVVAPPWPVYGVYGQSQRYAQHGAYGQPNGPGLYGPGVHTPGLPGAGSAGPGHGTGAPGPAAPHPGYGPYNPYRTQP